MQVLKHTSLKIKRKAKVATYNKLGHYKEASLQESEKKPNEVQVMRFST